jgi:hypothetical protein
VDVEMQDTLSVTPPPKKKHFSRFLIMVTLIALVAVLSNVFASSNISINGGKPVALGAGATVITACDDSIRFDVRSEFQTNEAKFKVTTLAISDIATTNFTDASGSHPGCDGEDLELNFYHKTESGLNILTCADLGFAVNTDISSGISPKPSHATCLETPNKGTIFFRVSNVDGNPANYVFSSLNIDPGLVDFISIMSTHKDYPYFIGGKGLGGGIVFFASVDPFTSEGSDCGSNCHYLEVAPVNWHEPDVTLDNQTTQMSWLANPANFANCVQFATGQSLAVGNQSYLDGERANWKIGVGLANTKSMHSAEVSGLCVSGASTLVLNFGGNDASRGQWFIPSGNEANELCKFAGRQETGILTQKCIAGTTGVPGFDFGVPVTDDPYVNLNHHVYWTSSASPDDLGGAILLGMGRSAGVGGTHWRGTAHYVRPIRAF